MYIYLMDYKYVHQLHACKSYEMKVGKEKKAKTSNYWPEPDANRILRHLHHHWQVPGGEPPTVPLGHPCLVEPQGSVGRAAAAAPSVPCHVAGGGEETLVLTLPRPANKTIGSKQSQATQFDRCSEEGGQTDASNGKEENKC